jgi:hypothetical protein
MNPYSVDFWKPMTDSLYRNDDLEKKSALNQMVHRTMDRTGRDRNMASSDIKDSLLKKEGSDPNVAKVFRDVQSRDIMKGAKPGWSQSDSQKFHEETGRYPGANDYSPGDQEINKRHRGLQLTDALMGPELKSKMIGTAGGSVQGTYDPRDKAFEDFQNNPETRQLLEQNADGTYVSAENMMNLVNNQYMGAGRVFVPTGERGMANVQEYFTHRNKEGEDILDKLANGVRDWTDDMDDSMYRTLGYDIPHSETSQRIQNRMLNKQWQDLASKPVDEGDGFDGNGGSDIRQNDLNYLDYDKLDGLDYSGAMYRTTGRRPSKLETAIGESIPMFADAMTLAGPAVGGLKYGAKFATAAALSDLLLEEAPMNFGLGGVATFLSPADERTKEELNEETAAINQQHQDFTTKGAPEIKKRLQNFLRPIEAKQVSGVY